jgi:hypothetical protein
MKFFDYKFIVILGLSVIVYFMYREVESLNKRVTRIESLNLNNMNIKPIALPLPLPLPEEEEDDVKLINVKNNLTTVEEYSNEIYSNDMGNSNTGEQDTMMLDSLVNMTNNDYKIQTETSDEETESINSDKSPELLELPNTNDTNKMEDSIVSPKSEKAPLSIDNIEIKLNENKNDLNNLLKNKLNELQEIAITKNISIIVEGTNKKKTKQQLAQDINDSINKVL